MPDSADRGNWLTRIGELRDGLLVLASLIYGLGYFVWSLHAWKQGLGLLPALDAQYFAAGIVPGLVIVAAYGAFKLITAGLERLLVWLHGEPRTRAKIAIRWAAFVLIAVLFSYMLIGDMFGIVEGIVSLEWATPFVIAVFVLLSLLIHVETKDTRAKWDRFYRLFQVGNIVALGAIVAVIYFVNSVYPSIPQELGGVSARCSYLDLDKSLLSALTLAALVPGADGSSTSAVRSKRLDMLYASSDVVMVRLDGQVYELDRQAIRTIAFCGSGA